MLSATRSRILRTHPLTARQAADYLQFSQGHLYNLISRGLAPPHIKYSGQHRFKLRDLNRWVASTSRAAADRDWSD